MSEAALYVSPDGDDGWSGGFPEPNRDRTDGPFASIDRALQRVSKLVNVGLSDPLTVYLRGGTYYLDEPLDLGRQVSGTEACPVTLAAYQDERAVISGGEPITGWRKADPSDLSGGSVQWTARCEAPGSVFRTLRVGDRAATRARYPSFDPTDPVKGGWLFADFWGQPWELGRFELPIDTATDAGAWLEWQVTIPRSATYQVWLRYVKSEDEPEPVSTTFGTKERPRAKLTELGVTGEWHDYRYARGGSVDLDEGSQNLVWENASGGTIHIDAVILCSDPDWDPTDRIRYTEWHPREYEVDDPRPGTDYLVIQAEACIAHSEGITLPTAPGARVTGTEPPGRKGKIFVRPGDMPEWSDWEGAEIHIFHAWNYSNYIAVVDRVDLENGLIFADFQTFVRAGNRFYIAGVREALSDPGEWHLDSKTGTVSYLASPDVKELPEVVAARLKTVIQISGSHIHLRDLVIADCDYSVPGSGSPSGGDAGILVSGAEHCSVRRCSFMSVHGSGVTLEKRSNNVEIAENIIEDVGQSGVFLTGSNEDQPYENTIAANEIRRCGRIYKHVAGVYITGGGKNRIAHNLIHQTPRYGISLKSKGDTLSNENILEFNDIRDTNLETADTGAIEVYGGGKTFTGNVLRHNRIVNSVGLKTNYRCEFMTPVYANGIYLDDWASGVTVYGNIIIGVSGCAVTLHGGWENRIENNILINGAGCQIALAPIFSDLKSTTLRDNTVVRNVIAYGDGEAKLFRCRDHRWYPEILKESDYNLFFCFDMDLESDPSPTPVGDLTEWRSIGFDLHSVVADPCFKDPQASDYTLQQDSPAFALGFKPIPIELIGPEGYRRRAD